MDTDPAVLERAVCVKSVIEQATLQGTGETFSECGLGGMLEKRARSENKHVQLVVLYFAQEVRPASLAAFGMLWYLFLPLPEPIEHVFSPFHDVVDRWLRIRRV
jgi:hypothetical protein